MLRLSAVCKQGPTGPVHTLAGSLPISMVFTAGFLTLWKLLIPLFPGLFVLEERLPYFLGKGGCMRTLVPDLRKNSRQM